MKGMSKAVVALNSGWSIYKHHGTAHHDSFTSTRQASPQEWQERLREIPDDDTRTLTQWFFGDPIPQRSALAAKGRSA